MRWYLAVLRKYATFSGRARRKEYWVFALVNFIVLLVLDLVGWRLGFGDPGQYNLLTAIYVLVVMLPSLAVGVRRLHDIGRSGWWMWLLVLPIIGALILLVWSVRDSEPGLNAYGPNPKTAVA